MDVEEGRKKTARSDPGGRNTLASVTPHTGSESELAVLIDVFHDTNLFALFSRGIWAVNTFLRGGNLFLHRCA